MKPLLRRDSPIRPLLRKILINNWPSSPLRLNCWMLLWTRLKLSLKMLSKQLKRRRNSRKKLKRALRRKSQLWKRPMMITNRSSMPKSTKLRMSTPKKLSSLSKVLKMTKIEPSLKLPIDANKKLRDKSISNWRRTRRRSKRNGSNVTRTFKIVRTLIIRFSNSPRIKRIRVMTEPWQELMDLLKIRPTPPLVK